MGHGSQYAAILLCFTDNAFYQCDDFPAGRPEEQPPAIPRRATALFTHASIAISPPGRREGVGGRADAAREPALSAMSVIHAHTS
jgi:hypothetical protein